MTQTQRQSLYEQYKTMSDERLKNIINDDSYEQYAKDIAFEILNGDRTEYYQEQQKITQTQQVPKATTTYQQQYTQTNYTVNDAIFQMARDIRFIKNIIIIGLAVVAAITFVSFLLLIV